MITRVIGLASTVIIARLLGKEGFGEFGIINSTLGMLGPLAGCMLGYTCTKNIAEHRSKNPNKASDILALTGFLSWFTSASVAAGLFIISPWVASSILAAPQLSDTLRISSLMIFFGALNGVQAGALAGFEAFKVIARINLIVGLLTFPMVITGVYFNGLNGLIWGLTLSNFINWILNHLALRKVSSQEGIVFRLRGCLKEWKILWQFSLPSMLTSMIYGSATWGCHALLVNQPGGYGKMGILNAANQWRSPILFLCNSIGNVVLPVLSSLNSSVDRDKFFKILKVNLIFSGSMALIISVLFSLLAPWILKMYGDGFSIGAWVFVVIVLATPFTAISEILGQSMISQGKLWKHTGLHLIWAVIAPIITILLVPSHGARGLAIAFGSSWLTLMVVEG
ncbi:MAG: oligosaccharide flippase family protein, partial [Nitrospinales bacterium]